MQGLLVEEEEFAGLELHVHQPHRVEAGGIRHLGEGHAARRADMGDRFLMGLRQQLHARVFDRDVVDGDPGGNVDQRFQRPVIQVLVPGDFRTARVFRKEIRRPENQIGAVEGPHAPDDGGAGGQIENHPGIEVARLQAGVGIGTVLLQYSGVDMLADLRHFLGRDGGERSKVTFGMEAIDFLARQRIILEGR